MKYILLLFLVGCVHVNSYYWKDGTVGYSIDCSGKAHDAAGICWRKAVQLCMGKKVKIVSSSSEKDYLQVMCE